MPTPDKTTTSASENRKAWAARVDELSKKVLGDKKPYEVSNKEWNERVDDIINKNNASISSHEKFIAETQKRVKDKEAGLHQLTVDKNHHTDEVVAKIAEIKKTSQNLGNPSQDQDKPSPQKKGLMASLISRIWKNKESTQDPQDKKTQETIQHIQNQVNFLFSGSPALSEAQDVEKLSNTIRDLIHKNPELQNNPKVNSLTSQLSLLTNNLSQLRYLTEETNKQKNVLSKDIESMKNLAFKYQEQIQTLGEENKELARLKFTQVENKPQSEVTSQMRIR